MSQNEYLYCRNNPVNYTDPDGDYVETALDIASVAYSANEFKKNRSWGNAGWLAFDAVMLALPIAPGSGVVRAGIKASKGVKTVKRSAKVVEKVQKHHEIPMYLGGAKKQKLVPLPKSYHQKVTNEFRRLAPYGTPAKNIKKSPIAVKKIIKKVYKKYPITKYKKR